MKNKTRKIILFLTLIMFSFGLLLTTSTTQATHKSHPDWVMGFDASYVTRVEDKGGVYNYADGTPGDVFEILGSYDGVDYIRLRVWNDPVEGYANKEDVLMLAQRAHDAGMEILLDFHYSDFWADPGQQNKPADWEDKNFGQLKRAVRHYTAEVVGDLMAQGTPPAIVQIGNEVTHGMLWPDGHIEMEGPDATWKQWRKFALLLKAGIRGVEATGSHAKIMIHIDEGGEVDNEQGRWFFDHLTALGVRYDIIGLSYYHNWHGPLEVLDFNIRDLRARYRKPVMIVETSYMFTLGWNDWTHNPIGSEEHIYPGYPATPEGQQAFLQALVDTAKSAGASGVFYWGGEWIATSPEDVNGSAWENQALFDFDGNALPALDVFTNN